MRVEKRGVCRIKGNFNRAIAANHKALKETKV